MAGGIQCPTRPTCSARTGLVSISGALRDVGHEEQDQPAIATGGRSSAPVGKAGEDKAAAPIRTCTAVLRWRSWVSLRSRLGCSSAMGPPRAWISVGWIAADGTQHLGRAVAAPYSNQGGGRRRHLPPPPHRVVMLSSAGVSITLLTVLALYPSPLAPGCDPPPAGGRGSSYWPTRRF